MSREATERGFGTLFDRQGRLNAYLVLGFIRSQIDLLTKTPNETKAQNEASKVDEAPHEVSKIDKIMEIVDDLTLDRRKYSFHDLFTALNEGDFSEERKAMFNTCLELIGIRE